MEKTSKHELFQELDMFCKDWQTRYAHLKDAATAARCLDLYADWLRSPAGHEYRQMLQATLDVFTEQRQAAAALPERALEDMAVALSFAETTIEGDDNE